MWKTPPRTFIQRADLPPAGDPSLAGVLAQGRLQEEDRHATEEEEDEVGDEEGTWSLRKRTFRVKADWNSYVAPFHHHKKSKPCLIISMTDDDCDTIVWL